MTIAAGALMQGAMAGKGSPVSGRVSATATTPAAARVWGAKGSPVAQTELPGASGFAAGPTSFGVKLQALLQSAADTLRSAQVSHGEAIAKSAQGAGEGLQNEQGMPDALPVRAAHAIGAGVEENAALAGDIEKPPAAIANSESKASSHSKRSQHAEKPEVRGAGSNEAAAAAPAVAPHLTAATGSETNPTPRNFPSQGSGDLLQSTAVASSAPVATPVVNLPVASGAAPAGRSTARMPASGSAASFVSSDLNVVATPVNARAGAERVAVTQGTVKSAVDLAQNGEGNVSGEATERVQSGDHRPANLRNSAVAAPVQATAGHGAGNVRSVPMAQSEGLFSRPDGGGEGEATRGEDVARANALPHASPTAFPQSLPQGSPAAQPTPAAASAIDAQLKAGADARFVQAGQADRSPAASEQAAVQGGAPRADIAEAAAKAGPRQSSASLSSVRPVQAAEHAAPIYGGAEMRGAQMAVAAVDRSGDTGRAAEATHGGSGEVFAALDAQSAPIANWVHADARHAEAGYLDPALGWVAVRAETSGAAVHASIVPSSADAAQVLGSHMPALSAYMAEHPTAATQVTMAAPEMGTAAQGSNRQMAGESGQQQAQQNMRSDAVDASGPALRGRSAQSSQFIPPMGLRSGSTISLVA